MQKSTTNLERITRFYEWMNTRSDVEIVKFQIDSNLLFDIHAQRYPKHMGKYHNALIEGITSVIDIYLSVSDSLKEQYHSGKLKREDESNISFPDADTNAYELYRILKIQWLYESIKGDCQHAVTNTKSHHSYNRDGDIIKLRKIQGKRGQASGKQACDTGI